MMIDKKIERTEHMENVISNLCSICYKVGGYFNYQYASDCICISRYVTRPSNFQFEREILDFIQDAVDEKIERDGKPKSRWEI